MHSPSAGAGPVIILKIFPKRLIRFCETNPPNLHSFSRYSRKTKMEKVKILKIFPKRPIIFESNCPPLRYLPMKSRINPLLPLIQEKLPMGHLTTVSSYFDQIDRVPPPLKYLNITIKTNPLLPPLQEIFKKNQDGKSNVLPVNN